ncbi:Uncharacterised protein [Mycobacteroides abscessus subsp. abscessus]|nr:Uncharacterised protein [Mycobacteroides abscessus subsp. abscessus]
MSTRLANTRSSRPGSARTTAPPKSRCTRLRSFSVAPNRARCAISSTYTGTARGLTTPAASRDESSRLPTNAVS